MTPNVGSLDKTIRLIAGAVLLALALFQFGWQSPIGIITMVIGAILIITGLINFCPLFKVLGIKTTKDDRYSN